MIVTYLISTFLIILTWFSLIDRARASQTELHLCIDTGEAYSASFLVTREHLLHQNTNYNLTWVNCEMGSFIMMNPRAKVGKNNNGSVIQTLDVLDFSFIHLSWYERLLNRYRIKKPKNENPLQHVIDALSILKSKAIQARSLGIPSLHPALERTIGCTALFLTFMLILLFIYS
jgi:hypothetical protein